MPSNGSRNDEVKSNGTGRHTMSIRFTPETQQMLEQLAFEAQRKLGYRVSYSALLDSLVQTEHARLSGPRKKALKTLWSKPPKERGA